MLCCGVTALTSSRSSDNLLHLSHMEGFEERKQKAKNIYSSVGSVYCPYFKEKITFNSDSFHHLQFSARREREKSHQLLKFRLLPLAIEVLRNAGTVQELRTLLGPIGKTSSKGEVPLKHIAYFGFVAILKETKVRVVVRKVGAGNYHFWSVMPDTKIQKENRKQELFTEGLEDA